MYENRSMSKISHNLQAAISNLEIKNIFINSSVAQHLGGDPLLTDYDEASINLKHRVKKSVVLSDNEDKADFAHTAILVNVLFSSISDIDNNFKLCF